MHEAPIGDVIHCCDSARNNCHWDGKKNESSYGLEKTLFHRGFHLHNMHGELGGVSEGWPVERCRKGAAKGFEEMCPVGIGRIFKLEIRIEEWTRCDAGGLEERNNGMWKL
ncbi:hypothetical protein Zmor_008448 [Zophobas morio]|uniref:Uncharacterized protein n=1 Tax=Zophobas morio TaxID=2755281 RepID=A0AA38MPS7_9CUCU|nr:hypothetical protein Zmor_008448 [Zophobas morio]